MIITDANFSAINMAGFRETPVVPEDILEEIVNHMAWMNVQQARTFGQFVIEEDDMPDLFYPEMHVKVGCETWLILGHSKTREMYRIRIDKFFLKVANSTQTLLIKCGLFTVANNLGNCKKTAEVFRKSWIENAPEAILHP